MSKFLKLSTIIITIFLCFGSGKANNLEIGIPLVVERNTSEQYVKVQFDISWDNSWRTSNAPNNYDGIWLFVKYKKVSDGNWYHATLNTENNSTGSQGTAATLQIRSDGVGAMFYRSADGNGTFSSTNVKLCWNYGIDGLDNNIDELVSEYKVFGVEMCYVPEGAFYVGSGGTNHFFTYGSNNLFQITSENALNVGQSNGYLWAWGYIETSTIPAAFPKAYNYFWCMKYEITQEQYSDFLNTLTPSQQANRFPNAFNSYRHFIKLVNGIYGCDGNNNNILNEAEDGQNIACNWLSWADGIAYSDWAGMRPITELEFEKACRGTATPVANEYACGNTTVIQATGISNSGTATEVTTPANANCVYNSASGVQGPVRVGNFARAGSSRQCSGASYYGIMELSGNLWERPVTIGNTSGRAFTGVLGDGSLDPSGNSNVTNWPGTNADGSGCRGGNWGDSSYEHFCWVSDRSLAASTEPDRFFYNGFRCVMGVLP